MQVTNKTSTKKKTGSRKRWFANIVASLPNDHNKIAEVCQFQSELKGNFIRIITRSFVGGKILFRPGGVESLDGDRSSLEVVVAALP
jgi:hypothetical protein